jgi:cytidylate kinase
MLAERLAYIYLDTGAMYRAVALKASRQGVATNDDTSLDRICSGLELSFLRDNGCCRVIANGEDISEAIRAPEISMLTSAISARKVVRDHMQRLQRTLGKDGGVILEGRDIGTAVFPDAELKMYLTASAEERGLRRYTELKAKGQDVELAKTIAEVVQRDRQDEGREHAPLRRADDAVLIDSTGKPIEDVLTEMERLVKERLVG